MVDTHFCHSEDSSQSFIVLGEYLPRLLHFFKAVIVAVTEWDTFKYTFPKILLFKLKGDLTIFLIQL